MIIVGIDFGDARTGLAVCDRAEMMASEAGCICAGSYRKTLEETANAVRELHAERIVVGNPKNMNGTEGPRSAKCQAFARELAAETGIEVVLYDERLTTVSAHKILSENNVRGKKRKNIVDALSARLILEDYMARRKNEAAQNGELV